MRSCFSRSLLEKFKWIQLIHSLPKPLDQPCYPRPSLKSRRWYKRLSLMFKIMKEEAPIYLINLIPKCEQTIRIRNDHIPVYHCCTESFKHSFFPSTLKVDLV